MMALEESQHVTQSVLDLCEPGLQHHGPSDPEEDDPLHRLLYCKQTVVIFLCGQAKGGMYGSL